MSTQRLGIIMHGVTGRMGLNQHLIRSILAIRNQGGVVLADGRRVMPDPILIGRNAEKMEALARAHQVSRWGTNLEVALANKDDAVFFGDAHIVVALRQFFLENTCDFREVAESRVFRASYAHLQQWDTKGGRAAAFISANPNFIRLGDHTEECVESVRAMDDPEKE